MNLLGPQTRVWLVLGATDMRKAINGLSLMVADRLGHDAFSGHLFAFCNRGRTLIKIRLRCLLTTQVRVLRRLRRALRLRCALPFPRVVGGVVVAHW